MLRLRFMHRQYYYQRCNHLLRSFSSNSSSSTKNPIEPLHNLKNAHPVPVPSPPPILQNLQSHPSVPTTTSSLSRKSVLALSATFISALVATFVFLSTDEPHQDNRPNPNPSPVYATIEHAIHKTNDSFMRILHRVKHTGAAAAVLWQSLRSVMSSANHEVRVGFELRVAALLADIASANASRRAAIVGAGGGAVVDWLLETVANPGNVVATQAEVARALAYLIADPNVSKDVLGRPHAVPNLLRFIFSCQPRTKKLFCGSSIQDVVHSIFLIL